MSHEMIFSKARLELIQIAKAMIAGDFNLIEGVRRLCSMRFEIAESDNQVFMTLRAIESETDHFPLGKMRDLCDAKYLERIDAEMNHYVTEAKKDILIACNEIIEKLSDKHDAKTVAACDRVGHAISKIAGSDIGNPT
jgi:Protein of unknown function (DUF2489)